MLNSLSAEFSSRILPRRNPASWSWSNWSESSCWMFEISLGSAWIWVSVDYFDGVY